MWQSRSLAPQQPQPSGTAADPTAGHFADLVASGAPRCPPWQGTLAGSGLSTAQVSAGIQPPAQHGSLSAIAQLVFAAGLPPSSCTWQHSLCCKAVYMSRAGLYMQAWIIAHGMLWSRVETDASVLVCHLACWCIHQTQYVHIMTCNQPAQMGSSQQTVMLKVAGETNLQRKQVDLVSWAAP